MAWPFLSDRSFSEYQVVPSTMERDMEWFSLGQESVLSPVSIHTFIPACRAGAITNAGNFENWILDASGEHDLITGESYTCSYIKILYQKEIQCLKGGSGMLRLPLQSEYQTKKPWRTEAGGVLGRVLNMLRLMHHGSLIIVPQHVVCVSMFQPDITPTLCSDLISFV